MNSGRHVLAQVLDFVHRETLSRMVSKYSAESKVRHFGVRQQLICMAFAQLTWRNGLRDIEACLNSKPEALYHLSFQEPVAKSTMADANEKRDWRLWEDLAKSLINRARNLYQGESLGLELDNTVYALDSSTIDLTMSVFPWAKFRSTKSGIKLHTQLDLRGPIPVCIYISEARIRHKMVGRTDFRTWSHLHHGQGVYRLGKTFQDCELWGFFCYSGQGQSALYQIQIATRRQIHRITEQPNRQTVDSQIKRGVPYAFAKGSLLRRRKTEALGIPNKQLANSCLDCGEALQKAMGDRVIFQVDQRQLGNQALLRHKRQRGEDTNLDSGIAIFDSGHHSEKPKTARKPSQYFADFECSPI